MEVQHWTRRLRNKQAYHQLGAAPFLNCSDVKAREGYHVVQVRRHVVVNEQTDDEVVRKVCQTECQSLCLLRVAFPSNSRERILPVDQHCREHDDRDSVHDGDYSVAEIAGPLPEEDAPQDEECRQPPGLHGADVGERLDLVLAQRLLRPGGHGG
eukprot:CAMPEP_0198240864 /NCGR_PEP_ID=MMETSP1446-20131203/5859_1 /TAXON_ID=1461542 ORGANISM="Unidentified sp, Strain CCMP2111" /NCGR_SAMPLE_ID=MMETSP1446 /ASSEMBLY_ACC=CAM_ASM_001112 /LENGTH=154 /DNA_ID=CAMNT_0043923645 /DNA_START=526 /DNA_END=986 /DNA_ORIENTATION=+